MKFKKGQNLSLTTIVIAVLVLIVLVVLILIVTGKLRETGEGLKGAEAPYTGETCLVPGTVRSCTTAEHCAGAGGINYGALDCEAGLDCCSS